MIAQFHRKRNLGRMARAEKKTRTLPQRRAIPVDSLKDAFVHAGMDADEADQRAHMRARSNSRGRELVREDRARKRSRSKSTGREAAKSRSLGSEDARKKVKQLEKASKIKRNREGRKGEGEHCDLRRARLLKHYAQAITSFSTRSPSICSRARVASSATDDKRFAIAERVACQCVPVAAQRGGHGRCAGPAQRWLLVRERH